MNERIRELAKEALDYAEKNQSAEVPQHWFKLYNEKFAELIIKECVEQGKQVQSQTVSNGSKDYNEGREMGIEVFMNQIKKHFGVEE